MYHNDLWSMWITTRIAARSCSCDIICVSLYTCGSTSGSPAIEKIAGVLCTHVDALIYLYGCQIVVAKIIIMEGSSATARHKLGIQPVHSSWNGMKSTSFLFDPWLVLANTVTGATMLVFYCRLKKLYREVCVK